MGVNGFARAGVDSPPVPVLNSLAKLRSLLNTDTPQERVLEILQVHDKELIDSINPDAQVFTVEDPKALQIAHKNVVDVVSAFLKELSIELKLNEGSKLDKQRYLPTVVIPLHGALKLAVDIINNLFRSNHENRFDLLCVLEKFVFTFKDPATQNTKYINIRGAEINIDDLRAQIANDEINPLFVDEMVDRGSQLRGFIEAFAPKHPPLVATPIGIEDTEEKLKEIYGNYFPSERDKKFWYISRMLPRVNKKALWWLTAGNWNSNFYGLTPAESALERNCLIPLGVLPDDLLTDLNTGKRYFANSKKYLAWVRSRQNHQQSAILTTLANEATSSSIEDIVGIVFGRILSAIHAGSSPKTRYSEAPLMLRPNDSEC